MTQDLVNSKFKRLHKPKILSPKPYHDVREACLVVSVSHVSRKLGWWQQVQKATTVLRLPTQGFRFADS